MTERLYTREDVMLAVNQAVDVVEGGLVLSDRDGDLLNLVVNTVSSVLDDPGVTLDDAIRRNYDNPPSEVKGWVSDPLTW